MKRATRVFVIMAFILNSVAACNIFGEGKKPDSGGLVVLDCGTPVPPALRPDRITFRQLTGKETYETIQKGPCKEN